MKIIYSFYFLLLLHVSLPLKAMFFKLGYEFQENHNICSWAKGNFEVDKKELFFLKDSESQEKLWKVVIDNGDIEFVLEPFSHTQKPLLNKAIKSMLEASKYLKIDPSPEDLKNHLLIFSRTLKNDFPINEQKIAYTLRNDHRFSYLNSFSIWKDWLRNTPKYKDFPKENLEKYLSKIWEEAPKCIFPLNVKSSPNISFDQWTQQLNLFPETTIVTEGDGLIYLLVKDQLITRQQNIDFQPQATIHYPLKYSIPLFFSLLEFNKDSEDIKNLVKALPSLNEIRTQGLTKKYFTKKNNLIFLHAQTLLNIFTKNVDETVLLQDIERRSREGQIDAKGQISFMSRRPFSDMWKDINKNHPDSENFLETYQNNMIKNEEFSKVFFENSQNLSPKWKNSLYPNYAEEIVNNQNKVINLKFLKNSFTQDFKNKIEERFHGNETLDSLLNKGVLSTTMIQNFDSEKVKVISQGIENKTPQKIFENYYFQAVETVSQPTTRFEVSLLGEDHPKIIENSSKYDRLSPPLFLSQEDSMGALKNYDMEKISQYGEAIIEVRIIKKTLASTTQSHNVFLTNVEGNLLEHSNKLFDFLNNLTKDNLFSEKSITGIYDCCTNK